NVAMVSKSFQSLLYPGQDCFGFTAVDGTLPFVLRIHSLLKEGDVLLDFGAGRGFQVLNSKGIQKHLFDYRNRGVKVIGVDVSADVLENPFLDEKYEIAAGRPLPFADASIDVAV